MPVSRPDLLRKIPFFETLSEEALKTLFDNLDQVSFLAGQLVFLQGDAGGKMYIVQSGKIEIFLEDLNKDRVTLSLAQSGDLFGELSLIDNEPRSASAKAIEDTLAFVIDRYDLEILFTQHPRAALDLLTLFGRRIREADRLVGQRVVARNPNFEDELRPRSMGERVADALADMASNIRFAYIHIAVLIIWLIFNLGIIPSLSTFDPFPFALLSIIVSIESLFLNFFVLTSQAHQSKRDKIRNDIEYEVNIKNEIETRDLRGQIAQLEQFIIGGLQNVNSNVDQIRSIVEKIPIK